MHHELEIIKNDLHCNAVRICGLAIDRLMTAAEDALKQGLEVWLSPEMWDKSQEETLDYLAKAAAAVEKLREHWPRQLVFSVGSELTLFMQGIVEMAGSHPFHVPSSLRTRLSYAIVKVRDRKFRSKSLLP